MKRLQPSSRPVVREVQPLLIRSAALPGAALRAMRTAAGRRAVLLALLVGAVFVLGVLCGERARAADGGPAGRIPSTIGSSVSTGSGTAPGPNGPASAVDALTVPRPDAADPIRPLTETAVRSVDQRIVRPVGDLIGTVTGRLDEATPGRLPALPALPALPGPERPAPLPELPHLPDAPEQTLPEPGAPAPQPGTSVPQPDTSTPPSGAPGQDAPDTPDEPEGPDGPSGTPERAAGPEVHGPEPVRAGRATHADRGHRPAQDAVHAVDAGPAPAPHAPGTPAGRSDGTTGSRPVADQGAPRHGDACAVTAHHRPPLRLVPGDTVRAEAAGTRDPYRDVPVSPA